ncbi:MAG: electron transport complex subunit RsxC [Rhodocyclaceae bacterium]|nr:electron transport complex subunit RsxC [Rhodocyclaceae bacterium]
MMRRLFGFWGGIKPDSHKNESTRLPVAKAPLPSLLTVPLRQNAGASPRIMVKAGDPVLKGQMIAAPEDGLSVALHAPTSGHVRAIEARAIAHPSGLAGICAIIEPDGAERWVELEPLDAARTSPEQLRRRLREAGLVGMGGAAFPSYVKAGGTAIDTLIINGAECEPWITCDDMLMRTRGEDIVGGAIMLRELLGARKLLIGIEDNKPEAIAAMRAAATRADPGLEVVAVPTRYPAGGEKQLIRVLTGLEIPYGKLPSHFGVQCFNVGTAAAVHRAVSRGKPLISRLVTLTGNVAEPRNYEVAIGMPVNELIALAHPQADTDRYLMGGPMMGFALPDLAVPVVKATNCIIAASPALFPAPTPEMPCIRCGACAQACPAELAPYELYWFARSQNLGKCQEYHLFDCIECGCCAFVCPSRIRLVDYYRYAKSSIRAREKDKLAADHARERYEFRLAREEREKQDKAAKLAAKAAETKAKLARASAGDESAPASESDDKKALIEAAMAKAREQTTPALNTDVHRMTAEQQAQVTVAEARHAAATATAAKDT